MAADVPVKKYSDIRSSLKTGDVITFEGDSGMMDWGIKVVEGGKVYTHVGLVIRDGDSLYFWDAPGGGNQFCDPYTHTRHPDARVADLDQLLAYYMSVEVKMWWRQLSPAVTPEQWGALRIFIGLADGMPFPGEDIKLPDWFKWPPGTNLGVGMALSLGIGKEFHLTRTGSFYCAHLAAESYMRMGLLPIAPRPANSYMPSDFDSDDPASFPLLKPWKLAPLIQVAMDVKPTPEDPNKKCP